MQFHLNGLCVGDPGVAEPLPGLDLTGPTKALGGEVDVLIVGCGPAGLTLAAQLSVFPRIQIGIVDQKTGPLELGQADGVACRTMEMFEAFGFSERVLREAYWVNETTFWKPDEVQPGRIRRSARVQDTEDGLSEFPHVILNQARVHDFYLEIMRKSPHRLEPAYGRRLLDIEIDTAETAGHPLTVTLERIDPKDGENQIETVRARYVVGCDGARSTVRKLLGRQLHGDSANQAWGVMDVLAVTDFPDIRFKTLIQSANEGSLLIIPREGGYLVRMYIELDKLNPGERVAARNITSGHLVAAAQRILAPYTLEVKEIAWWSVYEIGQRLCDGFDNVQGEGADKEAPSIFIAGDACHTHSPKAGQGMNVSMQDSFNLGWKLASVLHGQSVPELLRTYSSERHAIAEELIAFDREWAQLLSQPASDARGGDPEQAQRYFVRHGRYTAGTATCYGPSLIVGQRDHQDLAKGFPIGMRFHSAPVIRLADGKPLELGHTIKADGRWRLFAFAPARDPLGEDSSIRRLCTHLETDASSPVRQYTPNGADIDSVIDFRAVFQQDHHALALADMPSLLVPAKGRFGLRDYEKIFRCDPKRGRDVFEMRGIDRDHGCLVLVRPDQYVAHVLPVDAHDALSAFFAAFMISR